MNTERADIIIPGAVILESFMESQDLESIRISRRGLQTASSRITSPGSPTCATSTGGVSANGRSSGSPDPCGVDEGHARSTQALSLQLFDSARGIGLQDLGVKERDLLGFAALLHDTGKFISFANHHDHSCYVVRNADLLGFDDIELAIMANVVRVHRKKFPVKKLADCDELDGGSQRVVRIMGMFLRLAESLDRSHAGLVREAWFTPGGNGILSLEFEAADRCDLEVWAAEKHTKAFTSIFRKELVISPGCGPGPSTVTGTQT